MRYKIDFDKLVNQLVPYYLGGRKLILFLQALVKPLQAINEAFVEYAKETRIEATMTSQFFRFEWYLNRKFSKYFADPTQKMTLTNGGVMNGTPIYNEGAEGVHPANQFKLYGESEEIPEGEQTSVLYHIYEQDEELFYSFMVNSPAIDPAKLLPEIEGADPTESQVEAATTKYLAMVKAVVDRYKIANKTYKIRFNP